MTGQEYLDNTRGSLFMVLAMAAFAVEDMFIKASASIMPLGLILMLFGFGGMLVFMFLAWRRKDPIIQRAIVSRPLLIRAICEVIGRLFFSLAITLTPLSSAAAILQATPLVVILGAAIVFRERVGLMRWLAVVIGFIGVLMIIRPGMDSFNPASLFAVIGMLGFAGRDLATRAAPPLLSNVQLGIYGFFALIPAGLILQLYYDEPLRINFEAGVQVIGAIVFGVLAYNSLTIAMRSGDISVVAPFRYTRLLFALIIGVVIFDESPDLLTLTGGFIIVLSGVFTLLNSRRRARLDLIMRQPD